MTGPPAQDVPWYLSRFGAVGKEAAKGISFVVEEWMVDESEKDEHEFMGKALSEPRQWQGFALADAMEGGVAPGPPLAFAEAPDARREQRFVVKVREGITELLTAASEPMMMAKSYDDGTRFDIFTVGPAAEPNGVVMTSATPAFTLRASSRARTEWKLSSARCAACEVRARRHCGRREIMQMTHYREAMGGGQAWCMDVTLPASSGDDCCEATTPVRLTLRRPRWNFERKTLALNFYGRCSKASARNFQLVEGSGTTRGEKHKLLFGKVADDAFVLDHSFPLPTVHAFAAALSTSHWT